VRANYPMYAMASLMTGRLGSGSALKLGKFPNATSRQGMLTERRILRLLLYENVQK
jgi:hypothetical protein